MTHVDLFFLFMLAHHSTTLFPYTTLFRSTHDVSAFSLNAPFPYLNDFHHVALAWDNSTAKIYVDGVEAASAAYANPGPLKNSGVDFSIGGEIGGAGRKFIGIMDDVRLFNAAL